MVCAQGPTSISTLLVVASCPPDLISLLVNDLQSCVNSDQTSSDPLYLLLLLVYHPLLSRFSIPVWYRALPCSQEDLKSLV